MRIINILPLIIFLSLVVVGQASPCHAFQPHSAPEGLYVHQMAHLLFMGALAYLYWHFGQSPMFVSRGWYYLRIFCFLFMIWNFLTFLGHASFSFLSVEDFANMGTWHSKILLPISPIKLLYYIVRFEHLISIPAILFLFLGLRVFYQEVCAEVEQ